VWSQKMSKRTSTNYLYLEQPELVTQFNKTPFGFTHGLSELDLFQLPMLERLTAGYVEHPEDYFVAEGAAQPGARFYSAPHGMLGPRAALRRIEQGRYRLLLKRPERFDRRFEALLKSILAEICDRLPDECGAQNLVRAESGIFVTSAATLTPFHFDPEVAFFSQIRGHKNYHVYDPCSVEEAELERFYVGGVVCIGELELADRAPGLERVFPLGPGEGFHQPQNAPHWVETTDELSISYTVIFETRSARKLGRVRAFNHYLRRCGIVPETPGIHSGVDGLKALAMGTALPVRQHLKQMLRLRSGSRRSEVAAKTV
jgi:Cupin superfamily protein